jgi:voltage-gated potassium channel
MMEIMPRRARSMWRRETKTLLWVVGSIVLVMAVGTLGYMILFDFSFMDALYQTVTTITTVGFMEVQPLSTGGRVFTILLILCGAGVILYGLGTIVEYAIKAQLSGVFKRRTVRKQVDKLENHFIICGYGRVGESVARHFASQNASFVVIDNDPASLVRAEGDGFLVVEGDATNDEALQAAGIKKARGVVAAVGSDAGNIYVTLSARVLNPSLLIVARASSDDTASKLKRAGADRVVSPYGIGGRQMAVLMLKPLVSDYLDVVTGDGALEFRVEELQLTAQCCAVGRSIKDLSVRKTTGATILAVRKGETGAFDTNPTPEVVLESGDTIIAIGTPAEITSLEELVGAARLPHKQGV